MTIFDFLLRTLFIGTFATVIMDLWALVLHHLFGQSKANWAPVGRWVCHLARGTVFHKTIADAVPYSHERTIGWAFHYLTGIVYGGFLIVIAGPNWDSHPTLLPALLLGWVTVLAGWFLLQPGLGLGWAASKTPNPWKIRVMNLVAHSWFGLGLWGGALVIA